MAVNSLNFWVVFPLVFILYWAIPARFNQWRKVLLLGVSYLLYMSWKPAFALVLLFVTGVSYLGAIAIDRRPMERRRVLAVALTVLTVLPLGVFKYYNFINATGAQMLEAIGLHFSLPGLNWAIPVGISFFTFQALGYLFDVYRGEERAEHGFLDFSLFCSFFPQTASGPISKASELLPQFKTARAFEFDMGVRGLKWVLWGMVLKCMVADRLGLYVGTVFDNYQHFSSANCAWAAVLYSVQIYCDFAGYSLIAIGLAQTLGFNLVNNFNRPYFAGSITEFWRRWHISLTRWLTKYIYIPLGGSRCSKGKQYANIMATFLVSGLWHGANWTFVVWGGMHGLGQIGEKALGVDPKGRHASKPWLLRAKPLRIVITFAFVTLAWIVFRMPTIGEAVEFIGQIFSGAHPGQEFMFKAGKTDKALTLLSITLLFAAELRGEYLREHTRWLDSSHARWVIYTALFCMLLGLGVLDSGSFIYANF